MNKISIIYNYYIIFTIIKKHTDIMKTIDIMNATVSEALSSKNEKYGYNLACDYADATKKALEEDGGDDEHYTTILAQTCGTQTVMIGKLLDKLIAIKTELNR